jgi:hypothetical protein
MTHNEKRQHWLKEGAIGLGTGVLYGITVSEREMEMIRQRNKAAGCLRVGGCVSSTTPHAHGDKNTLQNCH